MNPNAAPGRNPWPIAIILFFAVFIAGVIAFTLWSTRQSMDLVRHDYYDEEITFQKQLDRLNRTQSMAAPVTISYDLKQAAIIIRFPVAPAGHVPAGSIQLYRPSDAQLDQSIRLAADVTGVQRLDARALRPGLWKVRVQWTANGQEYFSNQSVIIGAHAS